MILKNARFLIYLSVIALISVIIFAGCAKRAKDVAKVGELTITAEEFKTEFIRRYHTEVNAQKQSFKDRMDVLETLINRKLMLADAYNKGLDKKGEVVEARNQAQEQTAIHKFLYKKEVLDKIITEAAVNQYYKKLGEEVHARHILIKVNPSDSTQMEEAKVRIDSIHQLLMAGANFDTLAVELSEDPTNAKSGGDLGYFKWGKMDDAFQEAVFAMKKGDISEPVLSKFGYHIIELIDRREVERKPFDEEEPRIREALYRKNVSEIQQLAADYIVQLKEDMGLEYYEDSLNVVFEKISQPSIPQNISLFSDFTEEERKMVVASWEGGDVTVQDLDERIKGTGAGIFTEMAVLEKVIDDILMPLMLTERAKERGAYDEPEAVKAGKEAMERMMLDEIRKLEIEDKINFDDQTLMTYYENNPDKYRTKPQVTIREILVNDEDLAEELLKKGKAGENFEKLARKHTVRAAGKKTGGLVGPFEKQRYGRVGREAHKLEVGDFCKRPVRMGRDKYSIFRVEDKTPPQQKPFDECRDQARRDYKQEGKKEYEERWLEQLKAEIPLEIYEKNLRKVMPFEKVEAPAPD